MSAATAHLSSIYCSTTDHRRLTRPRLVFGAMAATLAVWLFAHLAGVDLTVRSGAGDVGVGATSVAFATLVSGLAACGLSAVLERISSRPRVAFTKIALAALVFSLGGPIGLGVGAAAVATLICIHLTAAAVVIPGLTRSTASQN